MAFGGGNNKLLDQIFNLKFTSKQLVRASKKCEQEEKEEKNKVRAASGEAVASGESRGAVSGHLGKRLTPAFPTPGEARHREGQPGGRPHIRAERYPQEDGAAELPEGPSQQEAETPPTPVGGAPLACAAGASHLPECDATTRAALACAFVPLLWAPLSACQTDPSCAARSLAPGWTRW